MARKNTKRYVIKRWNIMEKGYDTFARYYRNDRDAINVWKGASLHSITQRGREVYSNPYA